MQIYLPVQRSLESHMKILFSFLYSKFQMIYLLRDATIILTTFIHNISNDQDVALQFKV